jgi:3-deoxy-D-manno-octulosonate 8-phosphate phosphatase (KDO 8-P phosphatase)
VKVDSELGARARRVRAVVLDVDGVLTDASLYYGARGETLKRFSARDGLAIKLAQEEGLTVAILSGRVAPPLRARLADLGIPRELVIQGSREKAGDLRQLAGRLGLGLEELAFMGDDLPDLPALLIAGLAACPADAVPEVKERCHFIASAPGGNGAVRSLVELLVRANGRWDTIVGSWERGEARLRLDRSATGGKGDD